MSNRCNPNAARLLLVVGTALSISLATSVWASGAIGGGGAVSQYGQAYKQGKVIFFQMVACDRSECAVAKSAVSADFARNLIASIDTRGGLKAQESATDKIANNLSSDEAEKVKHYLARRFNVRS